MKRVYFQAALLLTLAMMFAIVPGTRADIIAPGGSTTNLTPANPGDVPIGLPIASITGTFAGVITGSPSGSYTAQVFNNSNGFLDFVYQFSNTGAADVVDSVTMANFAGFLTDVFVQGSGKPPVSAESLGTNPNVIKFFFSNSVNNDVGPGQSSNILVIATDATSFQNGVFTLQNGDTDSVVAFEPVVPEPSSMLLFGTGLSAVAATLRRRIKKPVTV